MDRDSLVLAVGATLAVARRNSLPFASAPGKMHMTKQVQPGDRKGRPYAETFLRRDTSPDSRSGRFDAKEGQPFNLVGR